MVGDGERLSPLLAQSPRTANHAARGGCRRPKCRISSPHGSPGASRSPGPCPFGSRLPSRSCCFKVRVCLAGAFRSREEERNFELFANARTCRRVFYPARAALAKNTRPKVSQEQPRPSNQQEGGCEHVTSSFMQFGVLPPCVSPVIASRWPRFGHRSLTTQHRLSETPSSQAPLPFRSCSPDTSTTMLLSRGAAGHPLMQRSRGCLRAPSSSPVTTTRFAAVPLLLPSRRDVIAKASFESSSTATAHDTTEPAPLSPLLPLRIAALAGLALALVRKGLGRASRKTAEMHLDENV